MTPSRRTLLVTALLLTITAVTLLSRASRATPHVRDHVIATMTERFHGDVELDAFQASVFPRPAIHGSGLVVRRTGGSDAAPIIRLGTFSASAGILGLLRTPVRLRTVTLDRLDIQIPRGGLRRPSDGTSPEPAARRGRSGALLTIDEIVAHAGRLEIASKDPGKLPRVFDIHDLHISGYGEQDGAEFRASLTNPKPRGRIATTGRLGPWQPDEPRTTPVAGAFTFTNADMNTIKGLGGTLSSRGSYSGVLERIEVSGETHTPDFSIDVAGQALPLATRFTAVVDGTNGNTYLERVDARLLESHIHARGAVVRTEDVKGRHIALIITIDNARIEDLLRLAMRGTKPPLTGAVTVNTTFTLPAGDADVIRKLHLDGHFALDKARFTNFNVQKRITMLSQKGKGEAVLDDGESTVSKLRGRFVLRDAALSFSNLTFAVPGAVVQLAGTYHLESELLDFAGHLLLDASLRETTSGVKAVLATIAQPFFRRKGGGTKIPIRVGGTRSKPTFGLDVKRALLPG